MACEASGKPLPDVAWIKMEYWKVQGRKLRF